MLAQKEDWETRRQYDRWVKFERDAWNRVDRVVVMSERDRAAVTDSVVVAKALGRKTEPILPIELEQRHKLKHFEGARPAGIERHVRLQ